MNNRNQPKDLEPACFYLRKSREDHEAEARGEGETLAKHKKALTRLALDYDTTITHIFEEIVSGESLIHRPEMLALLKQVESGQWKSVWCMDMDRLGRGNMQEQGLIIETFKKSGTKIVTPRKIYDLNDEFDEEYTEFEAFMARKELKIITRRLQGGRLRSVEEGNYLGTLPPYGYLIEKANRRRYLVKNPEQSDATDLIWKYYRTENMGGTSKIANELNRLGYASYTGKSWSGSSLLAILKNPVYAGITVWRKKEEKKSSRPGQKKAVRTRPLEEQIWIHSTHEPYVTEAEFFEVQRMLTQRQHSPYAQQKKTVNPLSGLIKCGICGSTMVYRAYTKQKPHLMCYNRECPNKSTRFDFVEHELIEALTAWLTPHSLPWECSLDLMQTSHQTAITLQEKIQQNLTKELRQLERQKDTLYQLLERKIYDEPTFCERSKKLTQQITETHSALGETKTKLQALIQQQNPSLTPKFTAPLAFYRHIPEAAIKNRLLKSVLNYATYHKTKDQTGSDFTLVLYPKLPQL